MRRRTAALLAAAALLLAACDPVSHVVVENASVGEVLVRRSVSYNQPPYDRLVLVHPLPAGSRITVAELGIARQYAVHRVEILTAECRVVWTMSLDGLVRPATIAVTNGPTVEFRPGDAPRLDDRPVTVQECGGSTEPEPGRSP